MHVELLWWEGCPSQPRALSDLRLAMAELGLEPDTVEVRQIETDGDAQRECFIGSPTIRVDGVDISPAEGEPYGLNCRVYHRRDGRISPTPDPADLRDALSAAMKTTTTRSQMPKIGEPAPTFSLPDTDGVERQPGGTPATVVIFTCNHCPYALAWHERTVDVARDYASRGVRVLAINPNDSERYPRDSPEAMRERVQAGEFDGVPYLRDDSQDVAHAYDAKTTPDVFVLDAEGILRYRGAPDGDYEDPTQDASWLREAIDAVLAGQAPARSETEPVGCSIKWRPHN